MSLAYPFLLTPLLGRRIRDLPACVLAAALLGSAGFAAEAAPARQAPAQQSGAAHPAPRGEVFLNGRWVSQSWCDATVPGPDGGPGGPGRGLCDASTPRR